MKDPSIPDDPSASAGSPDYARILQNILDVVCITDEHGVFQFVSPSSERLFGYMPEEMTGKSFREFMHPEDLALTLSQVNLVSTANKTANFENRYIRKDGSIVPVLWSAHWLEKEHLIYAVARDGSDKQDLRERFRSLVENGNDIIAIIHPSGVVVYAGTNVKSHLGFEAHEMPGRSLYDFVHPDDVPMLAHCLEKSLQTEKLTTPPYRVKNAQGNWCWMEATITNHLENPPIDGLVFNVRNITEQKRKEDALRNSEQRFRALVQKGSDLVTVIDKDFRFQFVSENVTSFLGYTPEELRFKDARTLVHPDDLASAEKEHGAVLQNEAPPSRIRHRFLHKKGHWVWVEAMGSNLLDDPDIHGVLVVSRDIDEQVNLQRTLDAELVNRHKQITAEVIKAQERERSQIGLELHDNVNQILTTVKLYNEMYLNGQASGSDLLIRSNQFIQQCINEIRSISKRLSLPTLGKISLEESIRELAETINQAKSLTVHCSIANIPGNKVSEDLHLAVYRIVQEALNNIIKYSKADKVKLQISEKKGQLRLLVADNGIGYDLQAKQTGIGLRNMRIRAEQMNATAFIIETAPGRGCTITISFPLETE